jgi:tetratricopeptide (TPR) repeat protein
LIDAAVREAAAEGKLEIIHETQFWHRLGLVETDQHVRRLYTPAMLAQLLDVSVSVIRRWHRRGLIVPVREVHRLPYFDFQEVATARRLAELLAAGATPATIERQLGQLARLVPDVERPLAQLSIIVEGRELLLRQGEGLIEPGGQMRLKFDVGATPDVAPQADRVEPMESPVIDAVQLFAHHPAEMPHWDQLLEQAAELEDAGHVASAIEMYRVALVAGGPRAEACFRLAELLYRQGDLTAARERYSMAIELDEDYVEARANLGCVLDETGQTELAIAAFHGALKSHPDYPDVHCHLARLYREQGDVDQARYHQERFAELAPDSPWA